MLTICISVLLINEVIIYQFSITKFWVEMSSGLLYCVAQMLVYNYFFLSHHRVFKTAKKAQKETRETESSEAKTLHLNDLSIFNTPDVTKDSFISTPSHNDLVKSKNEPTNENSTSHGSERAESEEIKQTNSFLLETAQGIQIFVASKRVRPSS